MSLARPAAPPAFALGTRLTHIQRTPCQFPPVETIDGSLTLVLVFHLDEGKASGYTAVPVCDDPDHRNPPKWFKDFTHLVFGDITRQIAHMNIQLVPLLE